MAAHCLWRWESECARVAAGYEKREAFVRQLVFLPRFIADIVRYFGLVIIKIANSIVNLGQGDALRISYFFWVFTRLEEKNDMAYSCTCTFDNRFPTIDGRVADNVRVRCTFDRQRQRLLPRMLYSHCLGYPLYVVYPQYLHASTAINPHSHNFHKTIHLFISHYALLHRVLSLFKTCRVVASFQKGLTAYELQCTICAMKGGGV